MNEIIFYGGLVLSSIFLLAAIILFFYNKVYSAISFLSHRNNVAFSKKPRSKPKSNKKDSVSQASTYQPPSDDTEILKSSEDYTEILCDDNSTEILE